MANWTLCDGEETYSVFLSPSANKFALRHPTPFLKPEPEREPEEGLARNRGVVKLGLLGLAEKLKIACQPPFGK